MSDGLFQALIEDERVQVYQLGDGVAMLASPPLGLTDAQFGDVVRIEWVDGEHRVGTVLRRGACRTYRFSHSLDRGELEKLLGDVQWLGATARATLADIVIGIPSRVDPAPALRAAANHGIAQAHRALRDVEVLIA